MTRRYVILGDGRSISLGAYVRAWHACRRLPAQTPIGKGISGWGDTAGEALRELRYGMDDRINRHLPHYGRGRKWSPDWQRETAQAAAALNTQRLVIRWLPLHLRPRFAERLEG